MHSPSRAKLEADFIFHTELTLSSCCFPQKAGSVFRSLSLLRQELLGAWHWATLLKAP